MGSAAFFAPLAFTVPLSGTPPEINRLSIYTPKKLFIKKLDGR